MDYAADEKRQKQTARLMLTLTNDINAKIAALSTTPGVRKTLPAWSACSAPRAIEA